MGEPGWSTHIIYTIYTYLHGETVDGAFRALVDGRENTGRGLGRGRTK